MEEVPGGSMLKDVSSELPHTMLALEVARNSYVVITLSWPEPGAGH